MSFPELTAFARHHESTPADDRTEQGFNLDRLQELVRYVRAKRAPELTSCLESAVHFVGLLAGPAGWLDRRALHELTSRTLALAESIVEAYSHAGAPAPAREPKAAVDVKLDNATVDQHDPDASRVAGGQQHTSAASEEPQGSDDPGLTLDIASSESEELETEGLNPQLPMINDLVLGHMLIELGYASRDDVAAGLRRHRQMGLPIGECLLLTGAVTADHLLETLKLQKALRAGLDSEESIRRDELSGRLYPEAGGKAQDAPAPPTSAGMQVTEEMFIGEVLLGAGMVTNEQLAEAMRVVHHDGLRVGDALIKAGALTAEDLRDGLELQERLKRVAGIKPD